VRVLVVGRFDDRALPRHADGQTFAAAGRRRSFDRWLELFEVAAREICPPEAAAHFVERARRIAASLELGIAGGQGVMLGNGERFRRNQAGAS